MGGYIKMLLVYSQIIAPNPQNFSFSFHDSEIEVADTLRHLSAGSKHTFYTASTQFYASARSFLLF